MSMGSSKNVKASGFSFRYLKILYVFLSARLNACKEENLEIYFGHSTRRCDRNWNSLKHVHPCSKVGKNHCRNSHVGACPETSWVKWLNVVMPSAILINWLPLPSQAWGTKHSFFFLSLSILVSANTVQAVLHSLMTNDQLNQCYDARSQYFPRSVMVRRFLFFLSFPLDYIIDPRMA